MANVKKPVVQDRGTAKRGDTICFSYVFEPPVGFNWTGVLIDCALTSLANPVDNAGAVASRINQTLTVGTGNIATYNFQLTIAEAKALVPGVSYRDECQLKQSGLYVATPVTGKILIVQDYVV